MAEDILKNYTFKVFTAFLDKKEGRVRSIGEIFSVTSRERAEQLIRAGYVKIQYVSWT